MDIIVNVIQQLGINSTFFVQFLLVTGLFFILKPTLWDKLLKIYEEREEKTSGARQEGKELTAKADEVFGKYEGSLQKIRLEADSILKESRDEANKKEQEIIHAAEEVYRGEIAKARGEISQELSSLKVEMQTSSKDLVDAILNKTVGRGAN
jgi:F-type H+-transporting ATPase subunit b